MADAEDALGADVVVAEGAGRAACGVAQYRNAVRRLSSDSVFAGAVEVLISHRGTDYRLRRTTLGKLILTK